MKNYLSLLFIILIISCSKSPEIIYNIPKKNIDQDGFIRDFQMNNDKYIILIKKSGIFEFLSTEFDDVKDPYLSEEESYKYQSGLSSRAIGFYAYKSHRYDNNYIPVKMNGKWGFISIKDNGSFVINPQYDDVHFFKEGLAAVKNNNLWGYIDINNNLIIDHNYINVNDFFSAKSIVILNNNGREYIVCIDKLGNEIYKYIKGEKIKYIADYYEPNITLGYDIDWGEYVINNKGKILIQGISDIGERGGPADPYFSFDEQSGLCIKVAYDETNNSIDDSAEEHTCYGAFNRDGEWVYPPKYKDIKELENNFIKYSLPNQLFPYYDFIKNKYGYKTRDSNDWKILPGYDYASPFYNDIAFVNINNREGIINSKGDYLMEPKYRSISNLYSNIYLTEINNKYGITLLNGSEVIKNEFGSIQGFDGYSPIYVEMYDKKGYINLRGDWIYSAPANIQISKFKNGIAFLYEEIPFNSNNNFFHKFHVVPIDIHCKPIFPDKNLYEIYEESGI